MSKNINIKKIISLEGKVRGDVLRTDLEYIKKKEGKKGFEKIENKIKSFGIDMSLETLNNTRWYNIGYKVLILELCRNLFSWRDKDIIKMGAMASKQSFIIRTILRYFISLDKSFKETPKYWSKYWDAGEFIPKKIEIKKKFLIISLKNLNVHEDLCLYFLGHFKTMTEMIINSKNVEIKEIKCSFKDGGDSHDFRITW
jgi:hypothetical protein